MVESRQYSLSLSISLPTSRTKISEDGRDNSCTSATSSPPPPLPHTHPQPPPLLLLFLMHIRRLLTSSSSSPFQPPTKLVPLGSRLTLTRPCIHPPNPHQLTSSSLEHLKPSLTPSKGHASSLGLQKRSVRKRLMIKRSVRKRLLIKRSVRKRLLIKRRFTWQVM